MTARSPSAPVVPNGDRGLPPRSCAETGARAEAGAAHTRRAQAPAATFGPVPYVRSVEDLKDDGLRRMIEAATAATVAAPARQWAPGTRRIVDTAPPAEDDRPVTLHLSGDQVAILRALAAHAADRAYDTGSDDDAWELEAIVRLLDAALLDGQGRAA